MKISNNLICFLIIVIFSIFPLFFNLPFRIHLDLPWEGAYRLYLGQLPYKDFGMPFGYGFFIAPLIAFVIFGPALKTLLYGQVLVNLLSGLTFMGLMKKLGLDKERLILALLVFSLSYTFLYFWPWYNHTAFLYEMAGLFFLLNAFQYEKIKPSLLNMFGAAFFTFLTFFTKQDYGGIAFLFGLVLTLYYCWIKRKYLPLTAYVGFYFLVALLFILPLLQYDFSYWFNYGQPPHENRLSFLTILNNIMLYSQWEKFYIFVFILIILNRIHSKIFDLKDEKFMVPFLFCLGMVLQALITKTTSGNSLNNTTFFHGFGLAMVLILIPEKSIPRGLSYLIIIMLTAFLWWSGEYWKYADRIFNLNKNNNTIQKQAPVSDAPFQQTWQLSDMEVFRKVKLPEATIKGIERVHSLDLFKLKDNPKILNMTELTHLALEWNYEPVKGLPLWYHKNVVAFPREIDQICQDIRNKEYDLVMFEEIPSLTNFFPEELRVCLKENYRLTDSFVAPRKEGDAFIEVFVRPEVNEN